MACHPRPGSSWRVGSPGASGLLGAGAQRHGWPEWQASSGTGQAWDRRPPGPHVRRAALQRRSAPARTRASSAASSAGTPPLGARDRRRSGGSGAGLLTLRLLPSGHRHHHRLRRQGAPDVGGEDHRLLLLRLRHLLLRAPGGRWSSRLGGGRGRRGTLPRPGHTLPQLARPGAPGGHRPPVPVLSPWWVLGDMCRQWPGWFPSR